ncbi:MAG: CPBP family intramembrane metalloprotease [Gemmatimonadota bacterium]|nr:CPBP family intramembrane metalloprotease [Gemmatimonadota bacterium]
MSTSSTSGRYWSAVRAPRYSLTFAFPLLVAYEALALTLSYRSITGVRNGADVLLKSVFVLLGGRNGLLAFGALLVGTGLVLIWRDGRRSGPIEARVFAGMAAESVAYASGLGLVTGALTGLLLGGLGAVAPARMSLDPVALSVGVQEAGLGLATQLMISLGAGIYEELLFRVLLVGLLAWVAGRLFGSPLAAGMFATIAGALIFSAFHYVGPYGDPLELGSFVFRAIAGVLFSALYLLRGFGIAAWTHAMYDVFLALAGGRG